MSKFENLLITQTERQLSILQDQSRYFLDWFQSERKLIDRILVNDSFTTPKIGDFWESATFYVVNDSGEIKGRWTAFNGPLGQFGLFLTNKIIRYKEPITLKSLAVNIKIRVRLAFNSEIWIITRGSGVKDPSSAIVKICKESEVDGIFIVFGSPIGSDSEFVFFKRQQIPEENFDPNEEFTELDVEVKDNGDDRVYVSVRLNAVHGTVFQTFCSRFVPSLVENRVMLAGTGRTVIVEKIEMQQKERLSCSLIVDGSKRQQCCGVF